MAERPIFVPCPDDPQLVREVFLQIAWHSGFAPIQKAKNIDALHKAACAAGYCNVLEVSTKSDKKRGQHLSAFHLRVQTREHGLVPLECVFQGSKVFERGGPFLDLYQLEPREAKRDARLKDSGALVRFRFEDVDFPLEPKSVFYDWLYLRCIYPHRGWAQKLFEYGGFSDIEFSPYRSINCQARSIALFLSLMKRDQLDEAMRTPEAFIQLLLSSLYRPQLRSEQVHPKTQRNTEGLFGLKEATY